jgi:hypothetical protein
VHGIGSQFRYATIQSVASRFMAHCGRQMTLPLGAFHPSKLITEPDSPELRAYLFEPPKNFEGDFGGFGFAEAFWADIPERAAASNNTTEESKAWARTIVDRVRAIDESGSVRQSNLIDYKKAGAVIAEMIDSIQVLENLLFVAEKAGLFEFELGQLLTDFLGDVQIVAEFKDYGGDIFKRFADTMAHLDRRLKNLKEIYIVAHSEGTVVSFKGLLTAMAAEENEHNRWVDKVRGYMTIGSPLNKHIVLWPLLWKDLRPHQSRTRRAPILWRNYYDFGDPVGFDLDITRECLAQNGWTAADENRGKVSAFSFTPEDDYGFTRYTFPGKAHNDYWQDDVVFGHFIKEVVIAKGKEKASRPTTAHWAAFVSNFVPYLLCLALLAGGTYAIYKTFVTVFGFKIGLREMVENVSGITCFLAGITVLGRMPRLERTPNSLIIGLLAFAAGAAGYLILVHRATQMRLSSAFGPSILGIIIAGFLIGAASAILSKWKPQLGMIPLIGLGGIVALMILWNLIHTTPSGLERPLWPLVQALTHSVHRDHLAPKCRGPFKIVLRAGAGLAENNLLRGTTAQHAADAFQQCTTREQKLVFTR